jgi:uncharacterized protein YjfI (DUF2170 family)
MKLKVMRDAPRTLQEAIQPGLNLIYKKGFNLELVEITLRQLVIVMMDGDLKVIQKLHLMKRASNR